MTTLYPSPYLQIDPSDILAVQGVLVSINSFGDENATVEFLEEGVDAQAKLTAIQAMRPLSLQASKKTIVADGVDASVISVKSTPDVTSITLLFEHDGASQTEVVALNNGIGQSTPITAEIAMLVTVSANDKSTFGYTPQEKVLVQ